jgi:hypothetical protein
VKKPVFLLSLAAESTMKNPQLSENGQVLLLKSVKRSVLHVRIPVARERTNNQPN